MRCYIFKPGRGYYRQDSCGYVPTHDHPEAGEFPAGHALGVCVNSVEPRLEMHAWDGRYLHRFTSPVHPFVAEHTEQDVPA